MPRLVRRRHGDTIELTDGCVCCSLAGGLAAAFDGLRDRDAPPDHVIVELSGIADPGSGWFLGHLRRGFRSTVW